MFCIPLNLYQTQLDLYKKISLRLSLYRKTVSLFESKIQTKLVSFVGKTNVRFSYIKEKKTYEGREIETQKYY